MTLLKLRCFPKTFVTCSDYSGDISRRTSFPRTTLFWYLIYHFLFFFLWTGYWISRFFNICNFFCSRSQMFGYVGFLKNYAKIYRKTPRLFLIKLQASYFQPAIFIKIETPAWVFCCEFWDVCFAKICYFSNNKL